MWAGDVVEAKKMSGTNFDRAVALGLADLIPSQSWKPEGVLYTTPSPYVSLECGG